MKLWTALLTRLGLRVRVARAPEREWLDCGDSHYLVIDGRQVAACMTLLVRNQDGTIRLGQHLLASCGDRQMTEFPIPTVDEAKRIAERWTTEHRGAAGGAQ